MSLIAFAVRTCVVRALLGQTLAGNAVEDSPIDAVAAAMQIPKPYIAVFTDTENNKPEARSLVEGHRLQDVSIHIILPTELKMEIGGKPYTFQGRESGASLVVDIIERQIQQTLMASQGVWANLWRVFVTGVTEVDTRAYVLQDAKSGVRTPAREMTLRFDTIFDPPLGRAPEGVWAEFIAALTDDPDTVELGPLIEGIMTGALLPRWRQDEADLGLANGDMLATGLGPITGVNDHGRLEQDQTDDLVSVAEVDVVRDGDALAIGPGS